MLPHFSTAANGPIHMPTVKLKSPRNHDLFLVFIIYVLFVGETLGCHSGLLCHPTTLPWPIAPLHADNQDTLPSPAKLSLPFLIHTSSVEGTLKMSLWHSVLSYYITMANSPIHVPRVKVPCPCKQSCFFPSSSMFHLVRRHLNVIPACCAIPIHMPTVKQSCPYMHT